MLQITSDDPGLFDSSLAGIIDHTLVAPEATKKHIEQLCDEALRYSFAAVCVNPSYVRLCANRLRDSNVKVCTVIGFPLGATSSESKAFETRQALQDGAQEVDMVLNIGMLKAGEDGFVLDDIRAVVIAARQHGGLTKVIIETALLLEPEKVRASLLAKEAGAEFVKTSTGFSKDGATLSDIRLIRKTIGPHMGIKASGGIRTRSQALSFVDAGATRIGSSLSVHIVTEQFDPKITGMT
jgi:deoxyribose-phosphate aldolase